MNKNASELGAKALIDFSCMEKECDGVVKFSLADAAKKDFQAVCPKCHRPYVFDAGLRDKLGRLLELVLAVRNAEDILGDVNVSVNVAGGSVKVPYALMLSRLNTVVTLDIEGVKTDFHLWVDPGSQDMFR